MPTKSDILIVGLGNPGEKYSKTRHNFGWLLMTALTKNLTWQKASASLSLACSINQAEQKIRLLKPMTFMNDSGSAVAAELNFYKIDIKNLWVVHDDLDLPLGTVRLSYDASAAGHNGVKSIIEHLGAQNFWRVRLGIGQDPVMPAENYVLQSFTTAEMDLVNKVIEHLASNLLTRVTSPEPKPDTITID